MEPQHSLKEGVRLMAHQVEGVRRFVENRGYCNFCEPGTGKTLMAIAAMNQLASQGQVSRVLIICPKTVKLSWVKEFRDMQSYPWEVMALDGSMVKRAKQVLAMPKKNSVLILNYESVCALKATLSAYAPDLVICDEAHAIKSPKSLRTKAIKLIESKYKWALTGTPYQSPLDVWSIVDWVKRGHFHHIFYAFRNRYCNIYTGAGFPIIKGYKNLTELQERLGLVSYRVTKEECMDLPKQTWVTRHVDLDEEEMALYKAMADEMVAEIGEHRFVATTVLVKLLRLMQITSGHVPINEGLAHRVGTSKIDALQELMEELTGPTVIWCQFRHEVDAVIEMFQRIKCKRQLYVLTGDTPQDVRLQAITEFQKSKDAILIGTMRTGGIGITLTAASDMVFFSNSWSTTDREQAEDRIHRKGQERPVTYYDLVATGTIDEYVLKVLRKKMQISSTLSGDDVRNMLYNGE